MTPNIHDIPGIGGFYTKKEVDILPDDTVESLTKAIQRKEYAILPMAIEMFRKEYEQNVNSKV